MITLQSVIALLATVSLSSAHIIITYPGWRGNNLHTNGSVNVDDYQPDKFPYGMQWMYPCGGMRITTNRTYWPTTGGAVAMQPGWFEGHSTALMYINMGEGTTPDNYSLPMQPVFELVGPSNDPYPDLGFCLPQVSPPKNLTVKDGDNATIQVVMNAKHGAALFSCVDITFTDNMDLVAPINESNCHNDSRLSFGTVFTTTGLSSAATPTIFKAPRLIGALGAAIFTSAIWLTL